MSALWKRGTEAAGASGAARTTQTYILGVGASGALLAGAGVALISLVGLVSFDVWPGAPMGGGSQEEAQLNFDRSTEQPAAAAGLGPAAGILTPTATTRTTGDATGGADDGGAKGSPRPPKSAKPPADNAPAAPPAPGPGVGDGGGSGSGSGSGSSGTPGAGNPPASSPIRNPNARSNPGKPANNAPGHSNSGGKGNASGNPGKGNGSGSSGKGNSGGGNKTSAVTAESTASAPDNSGSNSSSKPGLGKGR